ncbi:MAG: PAS domain S-box protein [Pseudomonadota bacterium]
MKDSNKTAERLQTVPVQRVIQVRDLGLVVDHVDQSAGIEASTPSTFDELEKTLSERTAELLKINHLLELEVEVRKQAEARLSLELAKFQALYDLATAMTADRRLEENLLLVVEQSRKLLGTDTSYIALRDERAGYVFMHTWSGIRTDAFKKMRIPFGGGLGGKVAGTGEGYIVEDYFEQIEPLLHDIVRGEGLLSGMAVPVHMAARPLGVLYAFSRSRRSFASSELAALSLLGNLAAMEIVRQEQKTELDKNRRELERRVKTRTAELMCTNRDLMREISRREGVQQALEKSELEYRTLFESAGDAIYVLDAEDGSLGRIVSANPTAAQMHGYTLAEMLGMNLSDLSAPESSEGVRERLMRIVGGENLKLEVMHRRKDGSAFPLDINARLLRLGNHKYILAVDRDITERKSAEEALRRSEERMRHLIELSPIGIRVARHGRYIYVNPAFARIFGYDDPEEIVGLPVVSLYVQEDRELIKRLSQDTSSGKRVPSYYEVRGLRQDRRLFNASVWVASIDYEGDPATLGFVVDTSKEKSLKDQLVQAQKMESLGTLAGGIAHDFNNILTVILGFSEMLLIGAKDEAERQKANSVISAAVRGRDLVRRIMTFSRKTESSPRPIDLNHELKQVEQLLVLTLPKMISVELRPSDDINPVNADPAQMEQLLLNLAVNAQQAMPDGGSLVIETRNVKVDADYCEAHAEVRPGDYVLLMVSDTGHGMDKEVQDRIFEPFFTTKKPGEGTGLGLSMVFGIVKTHGGHVTCYSEPGTGTTFKIYLPAMTGEVPTRSENETQFPDAGTETILLVDDDASIRDLGTQLLTESGYKVLTAATGREALDVYRREGPSVGLVILDLIMPDMGGAQCLDELLKMDPHAKVLISSGYSAHGPVKKACISGARGFLSKPYDVKQILREVRRIIDSD